LAKPLSPRGTARERVLQAALDLFAEHGVGGTSLQMIADGIGVTRAAVYYQFHSKGEIALALIGPVFDDIGQLIKIVKEMPSIDARCEAAIRGFIELMIRHRRIAALFDKDRAVRNIARLNPAFRDVSAQFKAALAMDDRDAHSRVSLAMVTSGIIGSIADQRLRDISDAELHSVLSKYSQLLLKRHSTADARCASVWSLTIAAS
jgi:AcrR family transcriptional regulator